MAKDRSAKKILKITLLSAFFLFIVVYAFFRSHDLIFGVKIKNVQMNGIPLQSGETVENGILHVTGNAKNAIKLTLNGREISIDQAGNFDETIGLLSGYNIVNIQAVDQFKYNDEKNYKLIFAPRESKVEQL